MIKQVSDSMARYIRKTLNLSERREAYLRYGFQVIIGLLIEIIAILGSAYFLGIFWPVMIALITFLILRPYAGGVHLPRYSLCLIVSLIVFLAIGLISIYITLATPSLIIWLIIITTFSLFMVNKYAPADTEVHPIKEPDRRQKLKNVSFKILTIWFVIASLVTIYFDQYSHLVLASSLGIIAEILVLHPFFYYLVDNYLPEHD
ncbi:accessory gene regulator ArgB-like protein [Halothermothrix orenii]|uniref:Accessory gene regulator B n=1 Tax=Halothermothrix orenii (strain H 168 / OCM 544 / DSM 9562) TaxID=373903 RepID=B8D0V4_HALOH|nr:accessory gene regulator B family protein [Halothermothrix orenii]ACL68923.1 Accessory gene regulator B [Halothermothrix orenii H 168]